MRYVMAAEDLELEVEVRPADSWYISTSPDGHSIYIYLEEDDNEEPELAIFKWFETGEAVDGAYLGTIGEGKATKHLYWVNVYEGAKYDDARGDLRESDDVPQVPDFWSGSAGSGTSG